MIIVLHFNDVCVSDVYVLKGFGGGSGSIVLYNVQCTGNEASLSNCSALSNENRYCEDAGVRCLSGMHCYLCHHSY